MSDDGLRVSLRSNQLLHQATARTRSHSGIGAEQVWKLYACFVALRGNRSSSSSSKSVRKQLDPSAVITRRRNLAPQTTCVAVFFVILRIVQRPFTWAGETFGAVCPRRCRQTGEHHRRVVAASSTGHVQQATNERRAQWRTANFFQTADVVDPSIQRPRHWANVRNRCAAQVVAAGDAIVLRHASIHRYQEFCPSHALRAARGPLLVRNYACRSRCSILKSS